MSAFVADNAPEGGVQKIDAKRGAPWHPDKPFSERESHLRFRISTAGRTVAPNPAVSGVSESFAQHDGLRPHLQKASQLAGVSRSLKPPPPRRCSSCSRQFAISRSH